MIIVIKPTYACNLACKYCYLSNDTKQAYRADLNLVKNFLIQVRDLLKKGDKRTNTILWHGGEPLLWGIDNYTQIFQFIEKEFNGYSYKQAIQTNLSLINVNFIDLFKRHKVGVSFSLDGTEDIHDSQRVDKQGAPTFAKIMEQVELCKNLGIKPGCIVVATKKHIGRISETYNFMVKNELNFKLNPLFCAGEAEQNKDEYSLTPEEFADMSIELFDLWYNDSNSKIQNQKFIDIASALVTRKTALCVFSKNCQDNVLAFSPYGDIFPCGRFCDNSLKEYSYGNITKMPLKDILAQRKDSEIYQRHLHIDNSDCKACQYYDICYGGCLHDGFLVNKDFKTKTFLCNAYKKVFHHIQSIINTDLNYTNK